MWAEDLTPGVLGLERGGKRNGGAGDGTRAWAENKNPERGQEAEECVSSSPAAGGGSGSCSPSSPQARARPGQVGLEQEAEGLHLQAAAAAGDTCRWGP